MKISQVNFSYNQPEDRLLFRFNTLDKTEFRMWLTRAMSIRMLGLLRRVVLSHLQREQPGLGESALRSLGEFRREAALTKADYARSFSVEAETFPMGAQPLLVTDIAVEAAGQVSRVTFRLANGQSLSLSLDHDLGVGIGKLLSGVMEGLDWGLEVEKDLPLANVGNPGEKMMLH